MTRTTTLLAIAIMLLIDMAVIMGKQYSGLYVWFFLPVAIAFAISVSLSGIVIFRRIVKSPIGAFEQELDAQRKLKYTRYMFIIVFFVTFAILGHANGDF